MKLLSVDYGRRRIGIAVTDESGQFIRGLPTIDRRSYPDFLSRLLDIIRQEAPGTIVVGIPLSHEDGETEMSAEVRAFAAKLAKQTETPVDYVDESWLSVRANELLRSRKKRQRRDKAAVDRLAACLILERYREEHGCGT